MISGAAIFHNIEKDSLMEIPYMAAKVSKQALSYFDYNALNLRLGQMHQEKYGS